MPSPCYCQSLQLDPSPNSALAYRHTHFVVATSKAPTHLGSRYSDGPTTKEACRKEGLYPRKLIYQCLFGHTTIAGPGAILNFINPLWKEYKAINTGYEPAH